MTFEEAQKRPDYHFYTDEIEPFIEHLRNNELDKDMFAVYQDGQRGIAVLEVGYLDIEVNLYSAAQLIEGTGENDMRPVAELYCCIKTGEEVDDWRSDDPIKIESGIDWQGDAWKSNLEKSMFAALSEYAAEKNYNFDMPNIASSAKEKYEFISDDEPEDEYEL